MHKLWIQMEDALRRYERAHWKWMNTSVFDGVSKEVNEKMAFARVEYEKATLEWEDAGRPAEVSNG